MKKEKSLDIRKITTIGILGAISIMLGITPLGFIPVGPTRATIMHIPVIIGAIMGGPVVGGLIGLIFGLFSIFQAATNPTPISFVFLNPIVSVLPRILIGIVTYYVYNLLRKLGSKNIIWVLDLIWAAIIIYLGYGIYNNFINNREIVTFIVNGVLIVLTLATSITLHKKYKDRALDVVIATGVGTLVNTVGVLSSIYFLYGEKFVEKLGLDPNMARKIIIGTGLANGIPEVIIAIIIVTNVVLALQGRKK